DHGRFLGVSDAVTADGNAHHSGLPGASLANNPRKPRITGSRSSIPVVDGSAIDRTPPWEAAMGKARYVPVVMLATLALRSSSSRHPLAQDFVAANNGHQYFRVDASPGQISKGRPIVRGYVYNTSPYQMTHVRLGVEPLDAGGAATGAPSSGWVNGEIPSN